MAISKVGLGWSAGERNYDTLRAWHDALKTTGVHETALCKGDLGASFVTIVVSDYPAGALIKTDGIAYTGANHTALAQLRAVLQVTSSSGLVVVEDLNVTHAGASLMVVAVTNGNRIRRSYIQHDANPGSNNASLMASINGVVENCVVRNTVTTASKTVRPSDLGVIRNCIVIGGNQGIQTEWTSSKTEKCYAVGVTTADYVWNNGRPSGNITNASEDATGDVGYRNLDPNINFVDYANADYRIKTTSPLHAAGIGAFFEETASGTDAIVSLIKTTITTLAKSVLAATGSNVSVVKSVSTRSSKTLQSVADAKVNIIKSSPVVIGKLIVGQAGATVNASLNVLKSAQTVATKLLTRTADSYCSVLKSQRSVLAKTFTVSAGANLNVLKSSISISGKILVGSTGTSVNANISISKGSIVIRPLLQNVSAGAIKDILISKAVVKEYSIQTKADAIRATSKSTLIVRGSVLRIGREPLPVGIDRIFAIEVDEKIFSVINEQLIFMLEK